jgi:hypothetical protein
MSSAPLCQLELEMMMMMAFRNVVLLTLYTTFSYLCFRTLHVTCYPGLVLCLSSLKVPDAYWGFRVASPWLSLIAHVRD